MMPILKEGEEDDLHFCGINCWWGKTEVNNSSVLQGFFRKTQSGETRGTMMLGSKKRPGSVFLVAENNVIMWAVSTKNSSPPREKSNDLTRRGGMTLNDIGKNELEEIVSNYGLQMRTIVKETPSFAITKVGLYDRQKLDLPYARGRVALLGDAAHPQTPFKGQGVNMAITDAYVLATRLSKQSVLDAINAYNSDTRRQSVNKVIKEARSIGNLSVSKNSFICNIVKVSMKVTPKSWLLMSGDKSNANFVDEMKQEIAKVH